MKNTLIIIISLIAVGGVAATVFTQQSPGNSAKVPIENEFANRIVYTTNLSTDEEALIADCQDRGGEFNDCGSACSDDAEVCTSACAYTCEL